MPSPLATPSSARDRQHVLLIASAAIASLAIIPALGPPSPERNACIALQIAMAAWTAAMALLMTFVPRRFRVWLDRAALVAPAVFQGAIAGASGGVLSSAFPWMVAVPIATAALLRDDLPGVALSSAASVVATGALAWRGLSQGMGTAVGPLLYVLAAAVLSVLGSRLYRAFTRRERASRAARLWLQRRLKASEHRRSLSERLAAVGQLALGVAREVSDPLAAVRANLSDLEDALEASDLGEPERGTLAEARVGVEQLSRMLRCLRAFSRETPVEPGTCYVGEAARTAMRSLAPGMASAIELDIPFHAARASADRAMLAEALAQLLANAVEAAAAGQRIPRVRLSARLRDESVDLFVDDSGDGVPAPMRPRLFEPFFTTKPPGQGSGLGLAIAREHAARMGGEVALEPLGPLGGARFRLSLPVSGSRPERTAPPPPRAREPARLDPFPARLASQA